MPTPLDPASLNLLAKYERSSLPDTLAGLPLGSARVRQLLDLDPDGLNKRLMELGRQAEILPQGTLDPAARVRYSAQRWDGQVELARFTAEGLTLCPSVKGAAPVDGTTLSDLADKKLVYQDFALLGQRIKDAGMELRLTSGGWMWFLVDTIMTYLEGQMNDPNVTDERKRFLLDLYGPALLVMARIYGQSSTQKAAIAAARSSLGAELVAAQQRAQDAETELAVRHDLPVSRQALLDAAKRHAGQGGKQPQPPTPSAKTHRIR